MINVANLRKRQLSEILNHVFSLPEAERLETMTEFMKDAVFAHFMRMAYDPKEAIQGLPPGMPDTIKMEENLPEGMADTTYRMEYRRIKNFLPAGGVKNISKVRREAIWVQVLEGIHHLDAKILTAIKDQELEVLYPGLNELLVNFGVPLINNNIKTPDPKTKGEAKKTTKKKTTKKKTTKKNAKTDPTGTPDSSDASSAVEGQISDPSTVADEVRDSV
jgi:hypothetical protein